MFLFRAFKIRYFGRDKVLVPPREFYVEEHRYVRVRAMGHGAMAALITLFFFKFLPGQYVLFLPMILPVIWKAICFIKDFVIRRKGIDVVDYFFDFWEWVVLGYGILWIWFWI